MRKYGTRRVKAASQKSKKANRRGLSLKKKTTMSNVLNRCITLLNRKSGTSETKQEYYHLISWLKNELKNYVDETITNKIKRNKSLEIDLGITQ
jgi:hypothetical protein